jgi:hypothetical protein
MIQVGHFVVVQQINLTAKEMTDWKKLFNSLNKQMTSPVLIAKSFNMICVTSLLYFFSFFLSFLT